MTPDLRILTINTAKCDGSYRRRIAWLVAEVARLRPDVIACQEAFKSKTGEFDTAGALAGALGMRLAWAPARLKSRMLEGQLELGWSGMALLSRYAWRAADVVPLPFDLLDGDRVAQFGVIEIDGVAVTVANLHLTHLRGADALRTRQLDSIVRHEAVTNAHGPVLLCGDFNTALDGPVISPFFEAQDLSFTDAYVAGGGDARLGTLPGRPLRIDHILSVCRAGEAKATFADAATVLDRREPVTGFLASDHYGVMTTLRLSEYASRSASSEVTAVGNR